MTVEIKEGEVGVLKVRVDDDPHILASEFASAHGLDSEQMDLLVQYIIQNQNLAGRTSSDLGYEPELPQLLLDRHEEAVRTVKVSPVKTSVHDRLYQHRKKMKTEVKSTAAQGNGAGKMGLNYGNWLYIKGMQRKEAFKVKVEKIKAEERQEMGKEMTFQPIIDRFSSIITPRIEMKTEEMLFSKAAEIDQKLAIQRSSSELLLLKQCSFAPRITLHAKQLSPSKPSYTRLYEDAAKRVAKHTQEACTQQFPFQPKLYASRFDEKVDCRDFLERMAQPKKSERSEREVAWGNKEKQGEIKKKEGSAERRDRDGKSIYDHLYSLKDKKGEYLKQASMEREKDLADQRNLPKAGINSEKYLQELHQKACKRLFSLIDTDEDGAISAIPEGVLDSKVCELLTPLLASGAEMTLEAFSLAFEVQISRLSLTDRACLLHAEAQPSAPISPEKPRERLAEDIYTRSKAAQQRIQAKLQAQQELQVKLAARDCTFRPFTVKGRRSYVGKSSH
jgi:hypothetical protein